MATASVRGGAVMLSAEVRDRFGLEDGSLLAIEADANVIVLRPLTTAPDEEIEIYTPERIAEVLLSNSINGEDYARAVEEVRALGLDPETIPHYRPDHGRSADGTGVDRLFLDSNVTFSAAYSPRSLVRDLWALSDVELLTSNYAVAEVRRNLPSAHDSEYDRLLSAMIVTASRFPGSIPYRPKSTSRKRTNPSSSPQSSPERLTS
jgi:bifunctional DNA-binding transcriptional regulator/antitoxin component of YhaV-PrlF toxin-antitoxin module